MPYYRGVEYAIRWKDGWEWEVYERPGNVPGFIRGLVDSHKIDDFKSDYWRNIAQSNAQTAIDMLLTRDLVVSQPERP